ncbi:hypothetical protein C3F00_001605 [Pseudomonas sp. MWU13-2860]|nr:hypothetical protein C3F00_001605 [Pseudomonas sp. MWU13-2860]
MDFRQIHRKTPVTGEAWQGRNAGIVDMGLTKTGGIRQNKVADYTAAGADRQSPCLICIKVAVGRLQL